MEEAGLCISISSHDTATKHKNTQDVFEKLCRLKHYNAGLAMLRQLYFGALPCRVVSCRVVSCAVVVVICLHMHMHAMRPYKSLD